MTDFVERHEPFVSTVPLSTPDRAMHMFEQAEPKATQTFDRAKVVTEKSQAMADRIRQLESENRRLQRLSITDELTCAYNRRHFRTSYQALLSTPLRPPAVALCLFDIDHFKAYNDAFGHPMGDAALRAVTLAINPLLRRGSDRLFRFGGDEFGALFSASSAEQAMQFIERFEEAVRALKLSHPAGPGTLLTATFGVAWHPDPSFARIDAKHLYSAADNTLYQAKHEGRNCILVRAMQDATDPGDHQILRSQRTPR